MREQRSDRKRAQVVIRKKQGTVSLRDDGVKIVTYPDDSGSMFFKGDDAFDKLVKMEKALLAYQFAFCSNYS